MPGFYFVDFMPEEPWSAEESGQVKKRQGGERDETMESGFSQSYDVL